MPLPWCIFMNCSNFASLTSHTSHLVSLTLNGLKVVMSSMACLVAAAAARPALAAAPYLSVAIIKSFLVLYLAWSKQALSK